MKRSFVESANSPYQFKKMIEESLKIKAAGILSNPDFQQAAALGLLEFQDNDDQLTPNLTPDELLKFFSQVVSYHDNEHPQGTLKRISSKTDTHSEEPNEDLESAYKKLFGTSIDKDPAFKHFFESEQLDEGLPALIPKMALTGAARAIPALARGAGSLFSGAGKLAGAAAGAIGRSVVRSAASSVADKDNKKNESLEEQYYQYVGVTSDNPEVHKHLQGSVKVNGRKRETTVVPGKRTTKIGMSGSEEGTHKAIADHLKSKGFVEGTHYTITRGLYDSFEQTYKNFIAEYEAVLEENGIYEYDLDEATEFFLESMENTYGSGTNRFPKIGYTDNNPTGSTQNRLRGTPASSLSGNRVPVRTVKKTTYGAKPNATR